MWEQWVTGQRIEAITNYFVGTDSVATARSVAADLSNNTFVWSLNHYVQAPPPPLVLNSLEIGAKILGKEVYKTITNPNCTVKFKPSTQDLEIKVRQLESCVTISGNKSNISVAQAVRQLSFPGDDPAGIARAIKRIELKDGVEPIKVIGALVGEEWCRTRSNQLLKTATALTKCKRA